MPNLIQSSIFSPWINSNILKGEIFSRHESALQREASSGKERIALKLAWEKIKERGGRERGMIGEKS
jgi:hypothetical protein